MLRCLVVSFLLCTASSKDILLPIYQKGTIYKDITLEKDKPLDLPVHGSLTLQRLNDLRLPDSFIEEVEPGGLCSPATLKRVDFEAGPNFKFTKHGLRNCQNLEVLVLRGHYEHFAPIEEDTFDNFPILNKLSLFNLKVENLTKRLFENLPSLEYLRIIRLSFGEINRDAFADLRNLKELEIGDLPRLNDEPEAIFNCEIPAEKLFVTGINGSLSPSPLAQLTVPELHLTYTNLEEIKPSLCSSFSLKRFQLMFGGDKDIAITHDIFKNCEHLEKLVIVGTRHSVEENAFENLPNLTTLDLASLQLQHVKRKQFKNLRKLEVLHLYGVQVQEIDEDAFTDLENLKVVGISRNENLTKIPENLFRGTRKLESLTLGRNSIGNFTWDEFKGLSALKELDVKFNRLSGVDGEKVARNLPSLNYFDLQGNSFECEEVEETLKKLRDKLNHSLEIECVVDHGRVAIEEFGL